LKAAAAGNVKALIVAENDHFATFPDRELVEQAIAKVELVIVLDYLDTAVSRKAHVFLPAQTLFEAGGLFVNQEGRAQQSPAAFAGGTPILETGGGDHPPRVYGAGLPGADPLPAWRLMARLAGEAIGDHEPDQHEYFQNLLSGAAPELAALAGVKALPDDGIPLALRSRSPGRFQSLPLAEPAAGSDEFEVILTERIFGTEELSSYSPCLETLEEKPFAGWLREDAETLGISEGDRMAIRTATATVELTARLFDRMAPGVVVIPRLRRLPWQALGKRVRRQDIRKA